MQKINIAREHLHKETISVNHFAALTVRDMAPKRCCRTTSDSWAMPNGASSDGDYCGTTTYDKASPHVTSDHAT
jgi:hypothetical protein